MQIRAIIMGRLYNKLPINTNVDKGQGCYIHVLDRHRIHLDDMIKQHSKVMQVRFDLRYPQDDSIKPIPKHIYDFNYNLQRKLKREKYVGGHQVDPRLITVSEKHSRAYPHIHGLLLVNANARRNCYALLVEIEQQWQQVINSGRQGLVDHCNRHGKNGIIIDRNKPDYHKKIKECIYQGSYLAKLRGKETNPKGTWLVTGTRIAI